MGLRIATNIASLMVQKNLKESTSKSNTELERLSSGQRITKASDDAAGLAIANNLEAQTKGVRQAARNASDGMSLVQTAEGGLNEVSNILVRLRELAVQSASDTLGTDERGLLDLEYQQLVTEVDRIANSTVFNGRYLLNGQGDGVMDIHVGAFDGDENKISFDSNNTNITASNVGISGTAVIDKSSALGSITTIDQGMKTVSGFRAGLGALQSRLQSSVANLEVQAINQQNAKSVIMDADIASSAAALASSQVLKSAGVSTLVQANQIPNAAIRLIG